MDTLVCFVALLVLCSYNVLSDLPLVARFGWRNNVTEVPLDSQMPMHVDIPRLREGKVGGFFWYVDHLAFQRKLMLTSLEVCIC
jgi:hypothetical protein